MERTTTDVADDQKRTDNMTFLSLEFGKLQVSIGLSEQPGTLRVSDVISIVTHTSPLKTNDVAAENKRT